MQSSDGQSQAQSEQTPAGAPTRRRGAGLAEKRARKLRSSLTALCDALSSLDGETGESAEIMSVTFSLGASASRAREALCITMDTRRDCRAACGAGATPRVLHVSTGTPQIAAGQLGSEQCSPPQSHSRVAELTAPPSATCTPATVLYTSDMHDMQLHDIVQPTASEAVTQTGPCSKESVVQPVEGLSRLELEQQQQTAWLKCRGRLSRALVHLTGSLPRPLVPGQTRLFAHVRTAQPLQGTDFAWCAEAPVSRSLRQHAKLRIVPQCTETGEPGICDEALAPGGEQSMIGAGGCACPSARTYACIKCVAGLQLTM